MIPYLDYCEKCQPREKQLVMEIRGMDNRMHKLCQKCWITKETMEHETGELFLEVPA